MTKEENILSNDLIEDDLLIKKDKLNILLETNEQDLTKNNSYEDKEENKGKKEDKRKFEKGYASKKNFILKSDFYNKKKVSDGKYQNINNIRFTSIINNYYNGNFIPKNIDETYATNNNNKELTDNHFNNKIDILQNNDNKDEKIIPLNLSNNYLNTSILNNSYNNIYNESINKEKQNYKANSNCRNNEQINTSLINNVFNIVKTNNYFYTNNNIQNINTSKTLILAIKDKYGCMMMKNKIILDPNYANEILFNQIKYDLVELCCDNFGNYFLQTFLDIITFENLNKFLDLITKDFTEICISPHGTRVIQKIIDKISFIPILINKFIYILNNKDLCLICTSQYGNHIIQKYLITFHCCEYTLFIYKFIYENLITITNSKHGVFIVQKCLNEGSKFHREKLYKLIIDNLLEIIQDQYGNYLIQFILLNTKEVENTFKEIIPLILKIEDNIIDLCLSKYSANAIERCFENSDNLIRNHILNSLFENHDNKIVDIFFNKYGFYVILKAAKTQNGKYKSKIIDLLNKNNNEVKSNIISKKRNYKNILKIIRDDKDLNDLYKILEDKFINENI